MISDECVYFVAVLDCLLGFILGFYFRVVLERFLGRLRGWEGFVF